MLDGVSASLDEERKPGPISGAASFGVIMHKADESK